MNTRGKFIARGSQSAPRIKPLDPAKSAEIAVHSMNSPRLVALAILILFSPILFGQALSSDRALKGNVYINADDGARVFLNGTEFLAHNWNKHGSPGKSSEVALKPGDRLVFQLRNADYVPGNFGVIAQFISADFKSAVNLPHEAYRILPDANATDFTPVDFMRARPAIEVKKRGGLQFKNKSEWTWGPTPNCTLGVLLSRDMIVTFTP